jgi:alkaline phosphatase D
MYSDGWDASPGARQRLIDAMAHSRARNMVCLGGDVHRHVAARLRRQVDQPDSPIVASEFVTSSITSKGLSELLNDWIQRGNPDVLHSRSDERGYALLDIRPDHMQCTFRATAHPVLAQASLYNQARYVVTAGIPGPQRDS